MKRKNLLKLFGIGYNKFTMEEKLHKLKMMKPLWSLSNWNSSNKSVLWGFRGGDLLKGRFRDRLYWVMFIVGFIMVYWWCGFNVEIISMFVYKTVIYKLYIGFIIGVIVSKFIEWKFSKFNWSKGENDKNDKNTSIIITVIVILLLSIVSNVGIGLLPSVYCDDEDDIVVY